MGSIRHILNSPAPILVALLLLAGCKTEKSPEDPTILGLPPQTAYLGVDYSYNFGTFGGDDLLNFSLSGAPSWMALEETRNKARKGIVLRGQPGISGGRRGEADLGRTSFIRLSSNDGQLLGQSGFQVEVKHNALRVLSATVREGQPYIPEDLLRDDDDDKKYGKGIRTVADVGEDTCELPDVGPGRNAKDEDKIEVDVSHNRLASGAGDFESDVVKTYETHGILIEVELDQPSVEPVTVKFEIRDNFDPEFDGSDSSPNCPQLEADDPNSSLPCEYRSGNRGRAIFGEDFALNTGALPAPPDYLEYLDEPAPGGRGQRGLLTFEPGITRCFIRAEVFDDRQAEQRESFTVELLEVNDGLASVRENGAVRRGTINIDDNAPVVSLSPESITLSRRKSTEVTATLNMENPFEDQDLVARIVRRPERGANNGDDNGTAGDDDFELSYTSPQGTTESGNAVIIRFPPGEDEATFEVSIQDGSGAGEPRRLDDLLEIIVDPLRQYGREFSVAGEDAELNVYINEWTDHYPIVDYLPTDIVSGSFGELYLAGIRQDQRIFLESINRAGVTDTSADDTGVLLDESVGDSVTRPVVAFRDRNVGTTGSPQLRRDLALAFTTAGMLDGADGAATNGSDNIALAFWRSLVDDDGDNADMAELWRKQVGSDGDDRVDEIALGSTSRLFLGGITYDDWDDPASGELQIHRGSGDILLSAVDTLQEGDGDDPEFAADRIWTKLIGSPAKEVFGGIGVAGRGELNILGSTRGETVSGSSVGVEDFIFNSVGQTGLISREIQFGSTSDDRFSHAAISSRSLWGAGASLNRYRFDRDGRLPVLDRNAGLGSSESPYVLVMDALGNPRNVITLDSESDIANQTVESVQSDGLMLYLAGDTDGPFAEDFEGQAGGYLARISYNEGDNEVTEDWRIQIPDIERIISMSLHDSRKIFLLVEESPGNYAVRLFNSFGDPLSE